MDTPFGRTVSSTNGSAGSENVGTAFPWHELRKRTTAIVKYLRMQEIPYIDEHLEVSLYTGYNNSTSK